MFFNEKTKAERQEKRRQRKKRREWDIWITISVWGYLCFFVFIVLYGLCPPIRILNAILEFLIIVSFIVGVLFCGLANWFAMDFGFCEVEPLSEEELQELQDMIDKYKLEHGIVDPPEEEIEDEMEPF